ncbi:hypothetical protein NG42_11040 [Winslowiella iniecta]|uniref:Uncharacterized protein n=1 Tax=Winslowiella iniecta TaxID=1560201 RepID=A0A0L7T3U8_9GAMM|nr:hypothetical protein NG42_11040 [Winslowiella iniecta]KOC94404.1 hypothetical protein NG43_05690 [Winslowiella iniecta]
MNSIAELVLIQRIIVKEAIKTLYESVLSRLARLDKTQLHAMLISPLVKRFASSQIDSSRSRIATKQLNVVQNTRELNTRNPESGGERQALHGEITHTG